VSAVSFQIDSRGVAVVTLDMPGAESNKLGSACLHEIEGFLNRVDDVREILENEKEIKAVVLVSGKDDNFVAGADFSEFLRISSVEEGRALSLKVQEIFSRIENSRAAFVAAIHGACIGVGLELSLACRFRVATNDQKTVFSMPEVGVGLIPIGGGTQRLPRLVGITQALEMILAGKSVRYEQAREIGLIDEVVPEEILIDVGKKRALEIIEKKLKPDRVAVRNFREFLSEKTPVGRKIVFNRARKTVMNKTNSNYLAPLMALEAVEVGKSSSFNRGLHVESVYFSELALSDVSRQLIKIFLAGEDLKKTSTIQNPEIKPRMIEKIAVVSVGLKGARIAALSAGMGVRVRLKDKDMESLGVSLKFCFDYFQEKCKEQSIATKLEMEKRLNLISAASDYTGFRMADIVFEAVPEDLEMKRRVLDDVEKITREDCIFASLTASIPIAQISVHAKRPGNVVGMHLFSPVHKSSLLEVVAANDTSQEAIATALELGRRLGKTPIVVKDGVGFYTTRIITPYFNEALRLLGEGATVEDVDKAMVEFGFPTGPLMLIDEFGIDEIAKIMAIVYEGFGERQKPPSSVRRLIEDGRLGRKNGRGFYSYNGKVRVDSSVYKHLSVERVMENPSREEIQERLCLAMINEALICLQEGIVRSPGDGDIGAVLGLGFPAFLGGPFRYVDSVGAETILKKLEYMTTRLGTNFTPAGLLRDLSTQGKKIYPDSK